MKNYGIITGKDSSLKSDNIAVGHGATISNVISNGDTDKAVLEAKMNELVKLLNDHQAEIENPEELIESTKIVSAELKKEKPNKTLVNSIMETIKSSVSVLKDVAALATTVHTLILPYIK
jgi:hypothetical protein